MRGIAVVGLIVIAGCGMLSVGTFSRVPVPAELQPEANQKLDRVVAASGVQIYRCDPKKDQPGQYEWVFQAPEAILRGTGGDFLGKHYAGPTWEASDGSKIVGTVQARSDAPDRQAIPWLRLGTRSEARERMPCLRCVNVQIRRRRRTVAELTSKISRQTAGSGTTAARAAQSCEVGPPGRALKPKFPASRLKSSRLTEPSKLKSPSDQNLLPVPQCDASRLKSARFTVPFKSASPKRVSWISS